MLEHDGTLWTWSLAELPQPGQSVSAEKLADHRLAYLDYEGDISNNRGTVTRVDQGDFDLLEHSSSIVRTTIRGSKLCGLLTIAQETNHWSVGLCAE